MLVTYTLHSSILSLLCRLSSGLRIHNKFANLHFDLCIVCHLMQVLGHTKTILVLLGGWMFLGDQISGRQFAGMCLAVAGMVAYGVESSK